MKSIPMIFALLLLAHGTVCSQEQPQDFAAGLVFDDDAYEALPRQSAEDGSKADLPPSVDLTPYCPEIRHQGYIFSCVGWAAGYGAMSIQRAILNKCTDKQVITRNAHSALFLYNQIKTADCKQGARISDALTFLQKNGDCLARQFDFEVNDCEQSPDSSVRTVARRFAIQDFLTLFGSNESSELKVLRVKKVLAAQKPVVVGMSVLRNFYNLKNAEYWHPTLGSTTPAGGHALVVVGYDEHREAFRLMNSWGKTWGDSGYIWVKYKDFGDYCKYAYAMYLLAPAQMNADTTRPSNPASPRPDIPPTPPHPTPTKNEPGNPSNDPSPAEKPLLELSGLLEFRAFTGWTEQTQQPMFETAPVVQEKSMYRLQKRDWPVGQRFQLLATAPRTDGYLYVFSVDAERAVHFHWPRQAGLNEKFEGLNESALLVAGSTQIAVPGKTKVLKLTHPGADRLVLLFSKKKIENVQKLADIVARKEGDFNQNLWRTLGKFAVPETDITYSTNHIGFDASTRSDGFIVPLVLEVQCVKN